MSDHAFILKILFTKGDQSTQSGGLVLRQMADDTYAVHFFNRDRGTLRPTSYYQGFYTKHYYEASQVFAGRKTSREAFMVTKKQILVGGS